MACIPLLLGLCVVNKVYCQTYVSGGIYATTTWTKAKSPYILTDTVVLFPGYTLTIQPGVTVKFKKKVVLEIRQSKLIALGTPTDSIVFTSDTTKPVYGENEGVFLNMGDSAKFAYCQFMHANLAVEDGVMKYSSYYHCSFRYNYVGIWQAYGPTIGCDFISDSVGLDSPSILDKIDSCTFMYDTIGTSTSFAPSTQNSRFIKNHIGIYNPQFGAIRDCIIDSNNAYGIKTFVVGVDSVTNCAISYNATGYYGSKMTSPSSYIYANQIENNNIGIDLFSDYVECNSICNNKKYNVVNENTFGNNSSIPNNYWCTNDSMKIDSSIYDGFKNITLGLVFFKPYDTIACASVPLSVTKEPVTFSVIKVYPNPVSGILNVAMKGNFEGEAVITNMLGQKVFNKKIYCKGDKIEKFNVSGLEQGVYILMIITDSGTFQQKLIKF